MRLICPNCDVQYAVSDDLIPPGGRDVQCSNCGQTWFQNSESPDPAQIAEIPVDAGGADLEVEVEVEPEPAPQPEPQPDDWQDAPERADAESDEDAEVDEAPALPPRRRLDASLLQVLREEAEREQAARRRDAENLEMQPELGVAEPERAPTKPLTAAPQAAPDIASDPVPDPDAVPDPIRPMAEPQSDAWSGDALAGDAPQGRTLRDETPAEEAAIIAGSAAAMAQGDRPEPAPTRDRAPAPVTEPAPRPDVQPQPMPAPMATATDADDDAAALPRDKRGPRRDLLPDIEEINSTLRASGQTTQRGPRPPRISRAARRQRQRGFRFGFGIALIAAGLALFAYSRAPMLASWMPAAEAPLAAYVSAVNDSRVWLDARLRQMVGAE